MFAFKHARSEHSEIVPVHKHRCHELLFLIEGDIEYFAANRPHYLHTNDVLLLNSREPHAMEPLKDSPYERIVVHFTPQFLRGFESRDYNLLGFIRRSLGGAGKQISGRGGETLEFYNYLREMEQYVKVGAPESPIMIRTLFAQALVILNRLLDKDLTTTVESVHKGLAVQEQYDDRVVEILSVIEDHLSETLSLEQLARDFGVSKHYLSRLFKRDTGYTLHEYVTNKRIMHAVSLLSNGATALEASQHSGFGDYSNFYKAFRYVTGLTPHQFTEIGD